MKKLMSALLVLACGVATGAECTSPPAVVWTDASGSLLWKTVREVPVKVSVDWPEGAASATLSVTKGRTAVTSVELADRSVKVCPLSLAFPETEDAEAVLDLTLGFRDSLGATLADATRTASIGLVRGVEGQSFRFIPSGSAVRQWKRVGASAVASVPPSAVSATFDGQPTAVSGVPGWMYLYGITAREQHTLVLNTDDSDSLSVPLWGIASFVISFR